MAGLPDGELMARASRGLAAVVAGSGCGSGTARASSASSAPGTTAATRCTRWPRLAEEGFAAAAVHARSPRTRAGWPRRARPAWRGRRSSVRPASGGRSSGGRPRRGRSARDRRPARAPARRGRGSRRSPRTPWVVAVDLPSGADPAGEVGARRRRGRRRDGHLRRGQAGPLLPATEPAVGTADRGRHRPRPRPGRPAVERLTFDDVRRLWPVPGPAATSTRAAWSASSPARRPTPARPCSASRRARAGAGHGPVRRAVRGPRPGPRGRPGGGHGRGPGAGVGLRVGVRPGRAAPRAVRSSERHVEAALGLRPAGASSTPARWSCSTRAATGAHPAHAARGRAGPAADPARGAEVSREEVSTPRSPTPARPPNGPVHGAAQGVDTRSSSPGPARPVRSQADAPAWLGTAGAGDVLGGLLGTLLAAGLDPLDAGALARPGPRRRGGPDNPGGPVRIATWPDAYRRPSPHCCAGPAAADLSDWRRMNLQPEAGARAATWPLSP